MKRNDRRQKKIDVEILKNAQKLPSLKKSELSEDRQEEEGAGEGENVSDWLSILF